MKEKAQTANNEVAIASTLQKIQIEVATQMHFPAQETIVKSLNRYKRKFDNALPQILHRKNIEFPEEFKDFVAYDKEKMITRSSSYLLLTEMLHLLETTTDLWLGDGTFQQCPDMLYQLCTIHVTVGSYNPPCIYALLPNQTEKTYHDFTQPSCS